MLNVIVLSVAIYLLYAECRYAECRGVQKSPYLNENFLSEANTPAYFVEASMTKKKSFVTLTPNLIEICLTQILSNTSKVLTIKHFTWVKKPLVE
jgi:hypothetical protein